MIISNRHLESINPLTSVNAMPVQAIPLSKKDKRWKKATMDFLEYEGLKQMKDTVKFLDLYKMVNGQLSFLEVKDMIPKLREVGQILNDVKIPAHLKHYDLIGIVINAFVGWLSEGSDKFAVIGLDSYETNEYQYTKGMLMQSYLIETWDKLVEYQLDAKGLNPDLRNFNTDEERQAYIQQRQQIKASMMPNEIEAWMNSSWKSTGVKWGDETLESDRQRFEMDEIDVANFVDYLVTGRCFRNMFVGFDYYKPERWSPVNTFYSKTLDSTYPQYGDYIGRVHYFTGGQVIARWGHRLKAKEKQRIIGGDAYYAPGKGEEFFNNAKHTGLPKFKSEILPFANYRDHQTMIAVEDMTGFPMGEVSYYDKGSGEVKKSATFLPRMQGERLSPMASALSLDGPVRNDMYTVTECYWVSYKKVLLVNYLSSTGIPMQRMVSEEVLREFLQDNGIQHVTKSMHDNIEEPEMNTYFEDYVPEVRYGVKISGANLMEDHIYLDCDPIPKQIHGDGNVFDVILPVAGYVGDSLVQKIYPWQMQYNLACNQLQSIMEKEIGVFFLTDVNFIPDDFLKYGDTENALKGLIRAAKSAGILAIDTSRVKTQESGGTPFNQFGTYDMTRMKEMQERIMIANHAKQSLFEQIGLTPQALGMHINTETAEGERIGYNSSVLQTIIYFNKFNAFKKKALDLHLAVAQSQHEEGKDPTIMYRKDDLQLSFLKLLNADKIPLLKLGVKVVNSPKQTKKLNDLKRMMLANNTLGGDLLDFAQAFLSDSMIEFIDVCRRARRNAQQQQQDQQNYQMQLQQQQAQIEQERDMREHEQAKELILLKGGVDVEKAQQMPSGNQEAQDRLSLDYLMNTASQNIQRLRTERGFDIENRKLDIREKEIESKEKIAMQKLLADYDKIAQRDRRDATYRYTSLVNR